MEVIDIIIAILLAIGFVGGLKDGLIKQAAGLVGLVAGLLLGKKLYLSVAAELTPLLGMSEHTTQVLAFVLILIVVPLLLSVVAWLISKFLKGIGLGWVNRLLGAVIGVLKYALLVGLVLTAIESFDFTGRLISQEKKDASVLYYPIYNVTGVLIDDVRERVDAWKQEQESTDDVLTRDKDGDSKPSMPSFEKTI